MKFEYKLSSKQTEFCNDTTKYILMSGGVGSSKTIGLVLKAIKLVIQYPGIFGLIGAQTYPLLRDTTLREFLKFCPNEIIEKYNKTEQHIWFKNGSEIIFRTMDSEDTKRGHTFGFIAIDEMSGIGYDVFKILRTRLRQDGNYPLLFFGCTNPADFNHWIYRDFIENPIPNSKVIYSSSFDNPFLPKDYLNDLLTLKETNTEYFERMVMGKWGSLEGLVYNFPTSQRIDILPKKFQEVWAGLDFGHNHPMALSIIGYIDPNFYIIDEIYMRGLSTSQLVENIKQKILDIEMEIIYCDPSRPEIIDDLVLNGINAVGATTKDSFSQIMFIKGLIGKKQLYASKQCAYHLREFDSYIWDKKSVKEIPLKINDDCMDAMRYAICSRKMFIDQDLIISTDGRTDWSEI